MGSFNIQLDQASKVMKVQVEGTFTPEEAKSSVEAYHKSTAGINVPDYDIDIDGTKLNVSAPDTIPMMEACFRLYKNDGFKNITLRISKNPVLKMQLNRVARGVQLANYELIEE